MKRRHLVEAMFIAVVAAGCDELTGGAGHMSPRIGEVANDPSAKEGDLAKLTTFGWDRLYLFKPGTSKKESALLSFLTHASSRPLAERAIRRSAASCQRFGS